MNDEDRCLWNRLVQEDGNFINGDKKLLSYERIFAVKSADAMIRSQAEQLERLAGCNKSYSDQTVSQLAKIKEQAEQIARLTSERDALAAQWEERKRCHLCHGTGLARVQYGMIYDTDSADEIEDAYRSVECPACSIINPAAILSAYDAALVAPLKSEIVELKEILGLYLENLALTSKAVDTIKTTLAKKDAEILRLENSILEADDYRTETGERDTMRAYRHINAEAAGVREGIGIIIARLPEILERVDAIEARTRIEKLTVEAMGRGKEKL